jgi:hypothetical protein
MSLFEVPKGLTDIRIVFDGTACGLNEVMWAPWFRLLTVKTMFRSLDVGIGRLTMTLERCSITSGFTRLYATSVAST